MSRDAAEENFRLKEFLAVLLSGAATYAASQSASDESNGKPKFDFFLAGHPSSTTPTVPTIPTTFTHERRVTP